MDIILEIFDTFLFDRLYSTVLPATKSQYISNIARNATAALPNISESVKAISAEQWVYQPASRFLTLEPSTYAYASTWSRDEPYRQAISLFLITWLFGCVVYFVFATLSYIFVFDKEAMKHPKYLKNQIRMEMAQTIQSLPVMAALTTPFFLAEVQGYAKLYDSFDAAPFPLYNLLQFPLFLIFTDFFIYWIHRGLHHPRIYKTLHKPHHRWIMPTPYASHAFHPLDGFSQSIPYHVFPFIFPLQKFAYVALFAFINIWTIMIHDGEYVANSPVINGAACHSLHHMYFRYNYGQFTTLWDRLHGSYRKPNDELFVAETKFGAQEWARQTKEMEKVQGEVEGLDDRVYESKKTL